VDWHTFLVDGDFGLGGAIAVVMVVVALIIAAIYRLALRPNT
jgi:ABC-type sugar transport system permease subunit